MTARVWAREELDLVHPLPGKWSWLKDGETARGVPMWSAVIMSEPDEQTEIVACVCVDREGRLFCEYDAGDTDSAEVTLAVLLVSMGREMAADGETVVSTEMLRLLVEAAEIGAVHVEGCGDQGRVEDRFWVESVRAAVESTQVSSAACR